MVSSPGDFVGQGETRDYDTDAGDRIWASGNKQEVDVDIWGVNGGIWSLGLAAAPGDTLHPGIYLNAVREGFQFGRVPGVDVHGEGRGCDDISGTFAVNQIGFGADGSVNLLDATVTQHCNGKATPPLKATIHIASLPLYVSLKSDQGDYVGGGRSKTYRNSTSLFGVTLFSPSIYFNVVGLGDSYSAVLAPPTDATFVLGRTYPTTRSPDATHAGLDVSGDGNGCNTSNGTVVVHQLVVRDGKIVKLAADFVQHCEGAAPALHGSIHYYA